MPPAKCLTGGEEEEREKWRKEPITCRPVIQVRGGPCIQNSGAIGTPVTLGYVSGAPKLSPSSAFEDPGRALSRAPTRHLQLVCEA